MPWGFTSARQPAPQRLTLEELLRLQQEQQYQPSARPAPKRSLSELDAEELRRVRQQSLFAGLAAAGASMQNRNWNIAGQAVGQIGAMQDQALYDANARQEQAWQAEEEKRAAEYQQRAKQTQQAAIYGMYQRAAEGEQPDSPWVARAEAAARAGNMSELATMASPEVKGKRASARAHGYDPDAWDTNERLTQELAAELKRQQDAAAWVEEKARLDEKAKMENDARLALEEEERKRRLGIYKPPDPPQYEPLERVAAREELVQSIRDKHQQQGASVTRIGQLPNGLWAEIHRADETHPRGWVVPIDGQPEVKGKLTSYSKDGTRYVINQDRPDLGALAVKEFEEGEEGAPTIQQLMRPQKSGAGISAVESAAAKRLAAVGDPAMKQKIEAARKSGYSDAEIAAYLGIH